MFVIHGQRFVARIGVQSPAHMGDPISFRIIPGCVILTHQLRIESVAFDLGHIITLNNQRDRRFNITLERKIDITRLHHQSTVNRISTWKHDQYPARPVCHGTRPVCPSPYTGNRTVSNIDHQITAGIRSHCHLVSRLGLLNCIADPGLKILGRTQALEHFRMLIRDHQHPGATLQNRGQFS